MDFETAFGHQLANQPAFEDSFPHVRIGVEHVTFGFDHQPAMGPEILRNRLGDLIIVQVHVGAALAAHCGFSGDCYSQLGAALETPNQLLFNLRLLRFGGGAECLLNAEILLALLTDRRVSPARFPLYVTALGARDRDRVWFSRRSQLEPARLPSS